MTSAIKLEKALGQNPRWVRRNRSGAKIAHLDTRHAPCTGLRGKAVFLHHRHRRDEVHELHHLCAPSAPSPQQAVPTGGGNTAIGT